MKVGCEQNGKGMGNLEGFPGLLVGMLFSFTVSGFSYQSVFDLQH